MLSDILKKFDEEFGKLNYLFEYNSSMSEVKIIMEDFLAQAIREAQEAIVPEKMEEFDEKGGPYPVEQGFNYARHEIKANIIRYNKLTK